MGNLASLTVLFLEENQLSGEIPAELGSLSNLTQVALGSNALSGEIPAWLGSLSNLETLGLDGNELSGCLPGSLEDRLDFEYSDLGDLPLLLKSHAPSAGNGQHIVWKALPARIGYGAWRRPSPYQLRSLSLCSVVPAYRRCVGKQAFPHFLGSEEGIEYWTRCSAGKMTSGEGAGHCGQRRGTERW